MKENKVYQLKVRMTERERQVLQDYAAAHNMTISNVVRMALDRVLSKEDK